MFILIIIRLNEAREAMKFVNREEELNLLGEKYKETGFQFVPVYGRRRIGKTRLIQEFIKDKKAIYFMADSVSETEQLRNLGTVVGEHFHDMILTSAGFKDWYQFFEYISEKTNDRLIAIIDEFPYLVNSNKAISSVFQKGIDQYLKKSNVFLILTGSSIGMMEKEVLFYKAPLYGRRTASLEVREMTFDALRKFFPHKNFVELVQIYSVFGNVPAYLEKVDPGKNIFSNIKDAILDRGSFLYNEVEFILREELREPRNYFAILKAIAQGKHKLSEIINETGFEKSLVSRYVDILRELGFIKKEIPVTEKRPEKSKKGINKIHDKFLNFWFKYIFPNRGRIEIGRADYVLNLIRKDLDHHLSLYYEDICLDLCHEYLKSGLMRFSSIGRWWTKDAEIDIVALDEETKTACFGECKWSNKKVGEDIYRNLKEKSRLVNWQNNKRTDRFMLFSRSGFTKRMIEVARREGVMLVHGDRVTQTK